MNTKKYSNAQEKAVAKKFGGHKNVNSGATPFIKGDVSTNEWLFECKTTVESKNSFSIKKEWLKKLKQEAFSMNKSFNALVFNFGPGENNYYVIDEKFMSYFMELLKKEN